MVSILPTLIIGLFGLVGAQNTYVVDVTDPTYVYNGNINSETGPGSIWQLDLSPGEHKVEFNGDIDLDQIRLTSNSDVSSLDFTYHGGTLHLNNYLRIDHSAASGPLTLRLTGDIFDLFEVNQDVNIYGVPGQNNTAYINFSNYSSILTNFWNINVTFHSDFINMNLLDIRHSNVIIDGDFFAQEIYVLSSVLWLDGKFTNYINSEYLVLDQNINIDPVGNVVVINDAVYSEYPDMQLLHFVSSTIHIAFVTDIKSISYDGIDDLLQDRWIVETETGNFAFIFDQRDKMTRENFLIENITVNKNGTDHVLNAIRYQFIAPPPITTTVTKDGTVETDLISYYLTPISGYSPIFRTGANTYIYTLTANETYSQPSETTAIVTKEDTTETDVISFFPTVGSDGKTHTGSTTYTLLDSSSKVESSSTTDPETYSQPPATTATVDLSSTTVTEEISFYPTVGTDGKTQTGSTTYTLSDNTTSMSESATPLPASTILETDIVSDNQTIHEVVIESGYTDSDGHIATTTWTELTMDMVDADPVYLSSSMMSSINESSTSGTESYMQPSPSTVIVTKSSTTETDVISYFPTVGTDGKTHTGTTTYTLSDNTTSMSESVTPMPATTILETDIVSDNQTIHEVVIVSGYTDSDGHIVTTTWTELTMNMVDADPVYTSSSMMLFANSSITSGGEAYTQPPETTTTVTVNDTTETIVITYCPIVGSDGKTHTSTSKSTMCDSHIYTQPPVTTATVTKEDGIVETVVVSCYPTVGSDGKTHTCSSKSTMSNEAKPTSVMTSGSNNGASGSGSGSNAGASGSDSGSNTGSGSHVSNAGTSGVHSGASSPGIVLQSIATQATVNSIQYEASGSTTVSNILFAAMMILLHMF
ncbi:hypothetical protein RNJ44_02408 [Nakaseomyces bracarensis]|uniref:Hyphally-regulated cell wall protein N-terminal domain-containing protein n=1 Tax=Nakaseomyces bracarensis TaxID=273131 RepID=A0ABR4NLM5_9SACH